MSDTLEELRQELRSITMEELSKVTELPTWRLREMVKQGKGRRTSVLDPLIGFPCQGCGSGSLI